MPEPKKILLEEPYKVSTIPVKPWSKNALESLRGQVSDLLFNTGAVDRPRGPILLDTTTTTPKRPPRGPVVGEPPVEPGAGEPAGGGNPLGGGNNQQPDQPAPRVIPCDNVIIDESDGAGGNPRRGGGNGGGMPPGAGQQPRERIVEIPEDLQPCIFTQHHTADNGEGWVVLVHIEGGRMKRVVVIDEKGNQRYIHQNVGKIIKVHKDNNKITVVGDKKTCIYFIVTNQLVCYS
ncbi:MAG: hypothetical protein HYT15_00525 [Candidatus Magasanikbacteria bacterium]|nr:hypothetical protein [Candidatus Magasanikbacteria bacterium]